MHPDSAGHPVPIRQPSVPGHPDQSSSPVPRFDPEVSLIIPKEADADPFERRPHFSEMVKRHRRLLPLLKPGMFRSGSPIPANDGNTKGRNAPCPKAHFYS
jgi:hypothetical protein